MPHKANNSPNPESNMYNRWRDACVKAAAAVASGATIYRPALMEQFGPGYAMTWSDYVTALDELLATGFDVNSTTPAGHTLLMLSAANEGWLAVKRLLAAGADVNAADIHGVTALMFAAFACERPAIPDGLLAAGADLHARDREGRTALWYAVRYHNPFMATYLRGHGLIDVGGDGLPERELVDPFEINYHDDTLTTMLEWAAMAGDTRVARRLLRRGAAPDGIDGIGGTAIQLSLETHATVAHVNTLLAGGCSLQRGYQAWTVARAVMNTNLDIVRLLVAAGAPVDAGHEYCGQTALMLTPSADYLEVLIRAGARFDLQDAFGLTAMGYAQTNRTGVSVAYLAMAGLTRPWSDSDEGSVSDEAAARASYAPRCRSPLGLAAMRGDIDQVRHLLRRRAALREPRELEPLTWAMQTGTTLELVNLLLAAGADVNAEHEDWNYTALMQAAILTDPSIVDRLIAAGASPNAIGFGGVTPLMLASIIRKEPAVPAALLHAGANLHARDEKARTALWYARRFHNTFMADYLVQAGLTDQGIESLDVSLSYD